MLKHKQHPESVPAGRQHSCGDASGSKGPCNGSKGPCFWLTGTMQWLKGTMQWLLSHNRQSKGCCVTCLSVQKKKRPVTHTWFVCVTLTQPLVQYLCVCQRLLLRLILSVLPCHYRHRIHTHILCAHAIAAVAADCSYTVQAGPKHLKSKAHTFCRSPMLLTQSVMRLLFLAGSSTLATACGRLLPAPACTAPSPMSSGIHACCDPHGRSP